jgi:hypothetical protein
MSLTLILFLVVDHMAKSWGGGVFGDGEVTGGMTAKL